MIKFLEQLYNLTYIGRGEDGAHLFKCNDCGKTNRIYLVSPFSKPEEASKERQPVPDAFYKAFGGE